MDAADHPVIPVRIYIAKLECLSEEKYFRKGLDLVSWQRREKIGRLRCKEDQIRSLGAGLLLRRALTDLGIDPDAVRMVYGANQKPRIEELSWLSFNLSHSGMRAMCSIGSFENGCDVERVHTMRMEQISSRFYSKKEQSFLASIEDQAEREDAFFRLWTLKESVIKFTGRGMTQGLDTFSMDLGGKHPVMTEEPGGLVSTCRFREYQLGDGYHYSCCAAEDRFEEDVRIVNLLSVL